MLNYEEPIGNSSSHLEDDEFAFSAHPPPTMEDESFLTLGGEIGGDYSFFAEEAPAAPQQPSPSTTSIPLRPPAATQNSHSSPLQPQPRRELQHDRHAPPPYSPAMKRPTPLVPIAKRPALSAPPRTTVNNGLLEEDVYTPAPLSSMSAPSHQPLKPESPVNNRNLPFYPSSGLLPPPRTIVLPGAVVNHDSQLPRLKAAKMPRVSSSTKRKRTPSPDSIVGALDPMRSIWSTFTSTDRVLLIGEGNFSFAYALAKRLGTAKNLLATDVEMHHELKERSGCDHTIMPLINMGATINCGTDVTKLSEGGPWQHHIGHLDMMSSIPEHRYLLRAFVDEAGLMLKVGGIALITVKEGHPYNSWDVSGLSTEEVVHERFEPFFPKDFPEYRHVTTVGAPIFKITPATTHVFKKVKEPTAESLANREKTRKDAEQLDRLDQPGYLF
eukprot:gene8131-12504_t